MPSARMNEPRPKEAWPSLSQTVLPSRSRQVNRPRRFLPTANICSSKRIGVWHSEFQLSAAWPKISSVLQLSPSRFTRNIAPPLS